MWGRVAWRSDVGLRGAKIVLRSVSSEELLRKDGLASCGERLRYATWAIKRGRDSRWPRA